MNKSTKQDLGRQEGRETLTALTEATSGLPPDDMYRLQWQTELLILLKFLFSVLFLSIV